MYEQVDFHFRYQPLSESPYALLLKYLQPRKKDSKRSKGLATEDLDESAEFPRERMILWALSAFWYPSACKALGGFSQTELRQKARNAIYQLLQQVYYLIQLFDLDPHEFVFPASAGELRSRVEAPSSSRSRIVVEKAEVSIPPMSNAIAVSTPSEEFESLSSNLVLARNEDDDELDKAFNS
jgi:hypothetical protein